MKDGFETELRAREHPLTLGLKTFNWNPIMACKDVDVSWDYDGTPLLPGETAEIKINLENVGLEGTIIPA